MKIYELQNTGKGVINSISLSNLLLIYSDEMPNLDSVIESNGAKLNNLHDIEVFEGINWRSYSVGNTEYVGQELTPYVYETIPSKPLYRIGTGIGNNNTEQSFSFFSTKTVYKDTKYNKGLEYEGAYEANFTDKSLVTKKFVEDSLQNLQKVITTSTVILDIDNNNTIFINNGATPITITIDSSITLPNFCVGFIQEGTGDVTFVGTGVSLTNPVGLKSKGQGYATFIERKLNTTSFFLLGNTKI